jgi:hypothetical protein
MFHATEEVTENQVENNGKRQKYRNYSEETLKKALEEVENGLSIYATSKKYSIPASTLSDRIKNPHPKPFGSTTVLSRENENLLAEWIIRCAKTRDEVLSAAGDLANEGNSKTFLKGTPTSAWLPGFLSRNPKVSFRTPSTLTRASANVTATESFLVDVRGYLEKKNLLHLLDVPSAWGNSDETGIDLNPISSKVLAKKGGKNVYRVQTAKPKERVSVMYSFIASGEMLMPQLIVKESTSTIADIAFACGGEFISSNLKKVYFCNFLLF